MMKLSVALRSAKLQSEKTPEGRIKFVPIEKCIRQSTLLTGFPIFIIGGEDPDCPFWDLIPAEGRPPKDVMNVVFLCSFLNCLWIAHGWTREQLADLVEKIEERLATLGLDEGGRSKQ
jgi:hypothetical protein